ncbi:MAG: transporter substrate-binding domain-containing protein [Burkholderiales bacterium]|nr:transporter substrate-binding domain-containing protein [Burkholderiales bacterium]
MLKYLVILLWLSCFQPAWAEMLKVTYPANESANDPRFNDLIEILQTALDKTVAEYGPYQLGPSAMAMNEARYLMELREGNSINVIWSSTSFEKERDYLPLRIPLRKGLLGYRIAFTAAINQAKIDKVKTIDDLRKLTIGQGTGWGDVRLYQDNGIDVITTKYENLFRMSEQKRFDLFPRGIGEIFNEFDVFGKQMPNLVVEKNLLLYYPWPYYFFFKKTDHALYDRVALGIQKMRADGSFDAIFRKYNDKAIRAARLKERRLIRLENRFLPKDTPLQDASLWFDPAKY